MKKTTILIFTLFSLFSFSQGINRPDRILTYGLSNYHHHTAMEFVGKDWNIEIYPVAGCIVSRKLTDSVAIEHTKLWKKMDSIHGQNSKERYKREVIQEMKRVMEVQEIFDSNKEIKKLRRKIERAKEDTSANLESSTDHNIYKWIIYSYERENNPEHKWIPEFTVLVNLENKSSKIIAIK